MNQGKKMIKYDTPEWVLVERAIRNAVPHSAGTSWRWVAVRDTFAVGSTVARDLCEAYGFDPEELVPGVCLQEDK